MAIRRDRDGRIQQPPESANTLPTRPLRRPPAEAPAGDTPPPAEPQTRYTLLPGERTQVFQGVPADAAATDDPVVGWLVVIAGPGWGRALTLGYGMNRIGRGAKARPRLDFGDKEISRDEHALITYDPRGRRFYLQHGGGANLTYLSDQPVLMPTELTGGEIITMGQTRLRFVPFCGADFDWQPAEPR